MIQARELPRWRWWFQGFPGWGRRRPGGCGRTGWQDRRVVGDEEDGRAGSAQRYAKDSGGSGQRQQAGQQGAGFHAVGLVDAVLHGGAEEIAAIEGEGGDQEGGVLDVGDGVGAGVGGGVAGLGLSRWRGWRRVALAASSRLGSRRRLLLLRAFDDIAEAVMPPR